MRVEHVRAFVALAEELNFRRAAARVFVSQPTLTAQIHQLERTLGVVLFDRGPGGTRLSDAGADLLPVAREVLRALDDLVDVAGGRSGAGTAAGHRRRVRVGVGPGGVGAATWPALQAFAARRKDLDPAVVALSFTTALPALDSGEVEALLLHGPVDEIGRRRVTTVGCVPVAVLVPTHHWMAGAPSLAVDDVVPHIRALPPPEMGAAFTRFWLLTEHRLSPNAGVRLEGEETLAMAREVARQGFVGFWPSDVQVPQSSGAVVRPLAERRWAPLQVVTREGWAPADDLVAVASAAVTAAGGLAGPAVDGADGPARPSGALITFLWCGGARVPSVWDPGPVAHGGGLRPTADGGRPWSGASRAAGPRGHDDGRGDHWWPRPSWWPASWWGRRRLPVARPAGRASPRSRR